MKLTQIMLLSAGLATVGIGTYHVFQPINGLPDVRPFLGLGPLTPPPVRLAGDSSSKNTEAKASGKMDKSKRSGRVYGMASTGPAMGAGEIPPPPPDLSGGPDGGRTENDRIKEGGGKESEPSVEVVGKVEPDAKPLIKITDPDEFIVEVIRAPADSVVPPPPPLP